MFSTIDGGTVKNLNINWSRENLFNIGKTISTYNSSKQTPEDFFNAALDSDWDYDVNYYKLSNTPVGSNSTFYVETVINGITIKDFLYKEQVTMSGTLFDIYYIVYPQTQDFARHLTSGLFCDRIGQQPGWTVAAGSPTGPG